MIYVKGIVAASILAFLSVRAFCDDHGLTPGGFDLYVKTLNGIKHPIETDKLITKLSLILGPDAKVDESAQNAGTPNEFYNIDIDDQYTGIRIQFAGSKPNLALPKGSLIVANGNKTLDCAKSPVAFTDLKVGDLVKLYGPWSSLLDGATSESGESMITFRFGTLKISVLGCAMKNPNDIHPYSISIDWPRPEWEK